MSAHSRIKPGRRGRRRAPRRHLRFREVTNVEHGDCGSTNRPQPRSNSDFVRGFGGRFPAPSSDVSAARGRRRTRSTLVLSRAPHSLVDWDLFAVASDARARRGGCNSRGAPLVSPRDSDAPSRRSPVTPGRARGGHGEPAAHLPDDPVGSPGGLAGTVQDGHRDHHRYGSRARPPPPPLPRSTTLDVFFEISDSRSDPPSGGDISPALPSSARLTPPRAPHHAGEHEHVISGYSLLKGIGDGEPIASDRFTVGGHEWVLLFYPDGKRSTNDPNAPRAKPTWEMDENMRKLRRYENTGLGVVGDEYGRR